MGLKPSGAASIPRSSRSSSGLAPGKLIASTPSIPSGKDASLSKGPSPPASSANDSSAPSVTSSYKSLQTYDRKKRPIHFRRTVVDLDDFAESQDAHKPGKHHMLRLDTGHGGKCAAEDISLISLDSYIAQRLCSEPVREFQVLC